MVMTPRQARGAGRFFGWFLAVSLTIIIVTVALLGGGALGVAGMLGIIAVALTASLLMAPLVWLLSRLSARKKKEDRGRDPSLRSG
jgi:hypothetical protein